MKDGAILANTGHFNVEIDIPALRVARGRDARGARVRRGVHAGRRPAHLPARRRPARQPLRRRGPPGARDGHVLREPGALGRVRGPERRRARAEGLPGAGRDRQGDRAPQARDDGRRDRQAHRGAGEVPRLVGRRNDVRLEPRHGALADSLQARGATSPSRSFGTRSGQPPMSSSSTSAGCRTRRSSSSAARRPRSPRRSASWRSAARRRSASPPRTAYALAAERGEDLDEARRACSRASRPTAVNLAWALERDARRPDAGARARAPRRGGRALPRDGGARRRAASRPARGR